MKPSKFEQSERQSMAFHGTKPAQVDNGAKHNVAILCQHECAVSHQKETLGQPKEFQWVTTSRP